MVRWTVALIASALSLALLAMPAWALTRDEARALAVAAGVPPDAEVDVEIDSTGPNGFVGQYALTGQTVIVVILPSEEFPDAWARVILFHEIEHVRQYQRGDVFESSVEREWDADTGGIARHCAAGGRMSDFSDLWAFMLRVHGTGHEDADHGRALDRVFHTLTSRACSDRIEAP